MPREQIPCAKCGDPVELTESDLGLKSLVVKVLRGIGFDRASTVLCRSCFLEWRDEQSAATLRDWDDWRARKSLLDYEKLVDVEIANRGSKEHRAPLARDYFRQATRMIFADQVAAIDKKRRSAAGAVEEP